MQIDKNTVIKCNNLNEVKDCLDKLQELGFSIYTKYDCTKRLLVFYNFHSEVFLNDYSFSISADRNYINYNDFLKLYNKQIKEKEPDLLVDKNGRVLKVNNFNNSYKILHYKFGAFYMSRPLTELKASDLNNNYYYTSHEALEKALKRKEIEKKLILLAFQLNGNKDIDWTDGMRKNYLYYDIEDQEIKLGDTFCMKSINIYCYSYEFFDKAIELIGEKDLKDYLTNY